MHRAMKPKTFAKYALFTPVVLGTGYYLQDENRRRHALRLAHAGFRITNLVMTAGVMVSDYTYCLYWKYTDQLEELSRNQKELKKLQRDHEKFLLAFHSSTNEAQQKLNLQNLDLNRKKMDDLTITINGLYKKNRDNFYGDLHRRNGQRLRDMCAHNGGVYIKIGQHLAMLDHVLPREYQESLVTLLADTPQSTYEAVERVFMEDFQKKPTEIFDSFDPKPIASASLAQVHIAYKNNQKFAVKVQHEGLRDGSDADRLVITKIVDVLSSQFREFNYRWLTKEMNDNLPLEMDFRNEYKNIQEITNDLKPMIEDGDVAVPTPISQYTSERVLTMTFEEGYHLNNVQKIRDLKLQSIDVSTLVSRIFSEQIFRYGFVHCDPHEANLLFRPHPTKRHKPQIVLLDHGLYRKLDDSFRKNYSRLWQSIILADQNGIEKYGKLLNAGSAYALLAAILTLKPWDSIISSDADTNINGDNTKKATDLILLQSYAKLYYQEIVDLLASVPSDLLLLFKTNDCLRHLDKVLNTPVNSTAVVAKTASNVIFQEELADLIQNWSGFSTITKFTGIVNRWFIIMSRVFLFSNLVYYSNAISAYYRSWMNYLFPVAFSATEGAGSEGVMVNEW